MATTVADVIYRIDGDDRLVYLDPGWDAFAADNEGHGLSSDQVYGRSLWHFISGAEVRHFHRVLLKRVRGEREPLEVAFRCDGPGERRYMRMRISPLPERGVEYCCTLQRREPRALLPVDHAGGPGALVRMCSWCNRVDVGQERWCELEEAIRHLDLFGDAPPPITHTMCDDCLGEDEEDM